jgi:ATP-dependent RNA helicase RhlE
MSFIDFKFNTHISTAIRNCGFTTPTPIQEQAIPPILARRDLLGLAQTGTGKTAAFVLPTVQHLLASAGAGVRVLILAPTRELTEQINDFVRSIIRNTPLRSVAIYGGVSKQTQIRAIQSGVDIVAACPGRLLDLLHDKAINLSRIETLVLDEADHMFDKGFLPDIRRILRHLPKQRQSLVFSATMPAEIRHLAEDILSNPARVQINHTRSIKQISHLLYPVEQTQKTDLLVDLLNQNNPASALVFTRTKHKAKNLALQLARHGMKATSLQGNLSQNQRQLALDGFKNGTFSILVATDIAARGIDVTGITQVINYDMPDTTEAYIHRTGRTGRASSSGEALTFATAEDGRMVRSIEQYLDGKMGRPSFTAPAVSKIRESVIAPVEVRPRRNEKSTQSAKDPRRSKRPAATSVFGFSARTKQQRSI